MKHNLMGKEKIEHLGFDEVNSWDNEEKVRASRYTEIKFKLHYQSSANYLCIFNF